jgi:hypothetical protein
MKTIERYAPSKINLYKGWKRQYPASDLILVDTCILMPAAIPREKRKLSEFLKQRHHVYGKSGGRELKFEIKMCKKRISAVDAIEEGRLSAIGKYPAITNNVYGELKYFEESSKTGNIGNWFKEMSGHVCSVFLDVKDYRQKYSVISNALKENADFSLAVASIELGCDIATDDYDSFEMGVLNRIRNKQRERWPRSEFVKYDSDSLCMLMGI